jgi:hypothetical protein
MLANNTEINYDNMFPKEVRLTEYGLNIVKQIVGDQIPDKKHICKNFYCCQEKKDISSPMWEFGKLSSYTFIYNGDFEKDFKPSKYKIFNVDIPNSSQICQLLEKKSFEWRDQGVFYARFRVGESNAKQFLYQDHDHDEVNENCIIFKPCRGYVDVMEKIEFTGKCKPVKAYIVINGSEIELSKISSKDFYLPLVAMCYTHIYFKFIFEEYNESEFKYAITVGNIKFINIMNYKHDITFNRAKWMIVENGFGNLMGKPFIRNKSILDENYALLLTE